MVARDEQKQTRGRAAWGDMVDGAVADMVAWDDALGVMMWVTATSRRKEGLTGTDWRRKAQERERQVPEQEGTGRKERASRQKGTGASEAQAQAAGGWRKLAGGRGARSGRTRKEAD